MKKSAFFNVILLVLLVLLVSGCASPATPTEADTRVPTGVPPDTLTILAFGDSLTEGYGVGPQENYPAQLQAKLLTDGYDVKVINGGISGETSSAALSRLDWMLKTQPDIVIVETGANDALRAVSLVLTRQNIDEIVRRFSESGAVVIVAGLQIIQNLGPDYTTEFAEIYPAVAEKHGAILIPFVLEGVAANAELNQADFIHPTGAGYAVMVEHIYPYILDAVQQAQNR